MNIICKVFGHSKTHWPVGMGSSVVFVWCSRCGEEFANASTDMRNQVHRLEHEVHDLTAALEYYKSEVESLKKQRDEYIKIVDRFIEKQNKPAVTCRDCGESLTGLNDTEVLCWDCQVEQDKFRNCEGKGI